jgi:hypothetical protein
MSKFLIVFLLVVKVFGFENVYTFDGEHSYREVLQALCLKSGRSVVGSSSGLNLRREFNIYKKEFHVAFDNVRKDLLSDGYLLNQDSSCVEVVRDVDSESHGKGKDSVYEVYLKYKKRYLITTSREEYLNAREEDLECKISDSVKAVRRWVYIYKCDLYLIGSTLNNGKNMGVLFGPDVKLGINVYPFSVGLSGVGFDAEFEKVVDSLNFRRHIIFYLKGDSAQSLIFGTDIRQVNSTLTSSTGAVSTNYEDVYDGLNLVCGPVTYRLTYRINQNQITLTGLRDSLVVGSSVFDERSKTKSWFVSGLNYGSATTFYLGSLLKVCKADSMEDKSVLVAPVVKSGVGGAERSVK